MGQYSIIYCEKTRKNTCISWSGHTQDTYNIKMNVEKKKKIRKSKEEKEKQKKKIHFFQPRANSGLWISWRTPQLLCYAVEDSMYEEILSI